MAAAPSPGRNPTTIFPSDAIGFCCDQIVQYVRSIDRFVWRYQGGGFGDTDSLSLAPRRSWLAAEPPGRTGTSLRIFSVSAAARLFRTVSLGNDFLYMSWDASREAGHWVASRREHGSPVGGRRRRPIEFTDPAGIAGDGLGQSPHAGQSERVSGPAIVATGTCESSRCGKTRIPTSGAT